MFDATIDRIEDDSVVCLLDDGREFVVPLDRMPDDVGEGDTVYVTIAKDQGKTQSDRTEVKDILNELLQSS